MRYAALPKFFFMVAKAEVQLDKMETLEKSDTWTRSTYGGVPIPGHDRAVVSYLWEKKEIYGNKFKIIDIGGLGGGDFKSSWSHGLADFYLDILPMPDGVQGIQMNLELREGWDLVLRYVEDHGRFNFSIFSQTMEDLHDPSLALEMLPQISDAGYIEVPSKFTELSPNMENFGGTLTYGGPVKAFRGFAHHKWIFTRFGSVIYGLPKDLSFYVDEFYDAVSNMEIAFRYFDLHWTWPPWTPVILLTADKFGSYMHRTGIMRDLLTVPDVDREVNQFAYSVLPNHPGFAPWRQLAFQRLNHTGSMHLPLDEICGIWDTPSCWINDLSCERCCQETDLWPHGDPACWLKDMDLIEEFVLTYETCCFGLAPHEAPEGFESFPFALFIPHLYPVYERSMRSR